MKNQVHWLLRSLWLPGAKVTWAEGKEDFRDKELSGERWIPPLFSRAGDQSGITEPRAERAAAVLAAAETPAPHSDHRH